MTSHPSAPSLNISPVFIAGFFLCLAVFMSYVSFYTVTQGYKAMVLRLGKIVTYTDQQPMIQAPGLHVKWPFLDRVYFFDLKLQTLNVDSSRILTQEQKYVIVDYYAKWQIENIPLYYTRTGGDGDQARLLLQQKINNSLRAEFGRRLLSDVVSDARETIMRQLQQEADKSAQELGIHVVDVRIKRIDLPAEVSASVFDRMRAERELVAMKHRADGRATAERIKAEADAKAALILANAEKEAAEIRATGQATAADIYAKAYSKDKAFYAFYQSLQAYQTIFSDDRSVFVLDPHRPHDAFFNYFNHWESP